MPAPENLGDLLADAMEAQTVILAVLLRFDFTSGVERYWLGAGPVVAHDPFAGDDDIYTWSGTGEAISVDGLEQAIGDQAPQATFTLSGVDATLMTKVKAASAEVKGRDVAVLVQFYDQDFQRLYWPLAVHYAIMDQMSVRITGTTATIMVSAETPLARRTSPLASGLLDQAMMFPADRGLERVPQLPYKRPQWPVIVPPD